jgi:hypothetical protein
MASVLHINAAGVTWWGHGANGWSILPEQRTGRVWVVTDLAEEALAEITVPRIFGTDRSRFVERQLTNRFPETVFRAAPQVGGSLMNRLAPPVQTLAAVEPAERIKTVLAGLTLPVAGVWSTSVLLSQLAQKQSPAANVLVVLSQASGMRIVFLKNHTPVLTRLVAAANTAAEQSVEILRTVRHLENTRVIERGKQRFPVLLLGTGDGLASVLAADRLDAVAPAAQRDTADGDGGYGQLFDLVIKSPPGQMAPLGYRTTYVAGQLAKTARVAGVVCLVAALVAASGSIRAIISDQRDRAQLQDSGVLLNAKIAELDAALAGFGVSPNLLRTALTVDSTEIVSAPDLQAHLLVLSQAVSRVEGARVRSLQWQVLEATEVACGKEAGAAVPVAAPVAVAEEPSTPTRKVELQLVISLAPGTGPRLRLQQAAELSRHIRQTAGITVLSDPVARVREGDLGAGSAQSDETSDLAWCAALPGVKPDAGQVPESKP